MFSVVMFADRSNFLNLYLKVVKFVIRQYKFMSRWVFQLILLVLLLCWFRELETWLNRWTFPLHGLFPV